MGGAFEVLRFPISKDVSSYSSPNFPSLPLFMSPSSQLIGMCC